MIVATPKAVENPQFTNQSAGNRITRSAPPAIVSAMIGQREAGLHEGPHDQNVAYWDEAFEIRQRQGQQLFRMASFRLAILGMLLSSLGAVIAFALIYAAIDHTVQNTFITSVRDEQSELLADMRRNHWTPAQAVNQAIQESPDMFFALVGKDHQTITGNLDVPGIQLGWRKFSQLDGTPLPPGILAVDGMTRALPNGDRLFIGRNATWLIALNTRLAYVFGGVFGAMTGLGLLASLLIAHSSLQRVRAISDASREIMAGDLSRRIKRYGRDDELDRLTDDLNAMLARMQVLVENLSQVTNDVAHDLRSPLTRLRERLELARDNPAHPQAGPAFDAALAQVDQIVGVFNALLRIAEIEASVSQSSFTAIDLTKLFEMLAEAYETVTDDNAQSLSVDIDDGLWVQGDRDLLIQMLINLIENSIRHCPAGTAICLSGRALAEGVELVVADDGPGVPEADRARVLQRFIRLDTARHSQGNGLGLALVAAVVTLHRGRIVLDDNKPGLQVRITFPVP
jgi:signal transduction histidine kinase